jgi:predicted DNA-binding protein YlxM (UPF0122 family)
MAKDLKFVMLLDCYGDLLTEHQRSIAELYYCEDLSLAEIGTPLGITRQAVMSIIKRTEGILLNYEEKLGFAEKLAGIEECLVRMEELAGNIAGSDIKNGISREIGNIRELL